MAIEQNSLRYYCLMKPSLFISYSLREAPFTDSLADKLTDQGYDLWLDYKSLVPARPWKEQIDQGLVESEVVVLVVSKEAIKSPYVKLEWERAIELGKRIVLVIFETIELPPELSGYEWVDFRTSFDAGLKELAIQLESPVTKEAEPPQKGFKAPRVVWICFWPSLLDHQPTNPRCQRSAGDTPRE